MTDGQQLKRGTRTDSIKILSINCLNLIRRTSPGYLLQIFKLLDFRLQLGMGLDNISLVVPFGAEMFLRFIILDKEGN